MDYTIAETYTLPSRGKIYGTAVSDQVKLRSMTIEEEMKRLSHTDTPYKTLCEVIDDCVVEPIGISSYEMCLGDYQYLLHRLRVVTYGPQYQLSSICPVCGKVNKGTLDLDGIEVFSLDTDEKLKEFNSLLDLTLPKTGKHIKLKFQTPKDLEEIAKEEKEWGDKNPDNNQNINYLLTLRHLIESVDGKHPNTILLDNFLRKLPMADSNLLIQRATKINEKVGINTVINNVCSNSKCGAKYKTSFRITPEFFGPTVDE